MSSDPDDGLTWLAFAESNAELSDDAKLLAVVLSDGFVAFGSRINMLSLEALQASGLETFDRFNPAQRELKSAGLLTGRGRPDRPFYSQYPRAAA